MSILLEFLSILAIIMAACSCVITIFLYKFAEKGILAIDKKVESMIQYSLEAKIEVEAMKKSTHTVQYIDPEIDKLNADFLREKEKRLKLKDQANDALEKAVNPDEELFGF